MYMYFSVILITEMSISRYYTVVTRLTASIDSVFQVALTVHKV